MAKTCEKVETKLSPTSHNWVTLIYTLNASIGNFGKENSEMSETCHDAFRATSVREELNNIT